MAKYSGIVEGFYWTPEDAVNGQHSEFNSKKRNKLLKFMAKKKLNTYVYDPKLLREGKKYYLERSINPSLIGNLTQWKETFYVAKKNKIDFVWGIAPGAYNSCGTHHLGWKNYEKNIYYIINKVLSLGAPKIALLFDDCPGVGHNNEKKHQANLAEKINKYFPEKMFCLCPSSYSGPKSYLEKENRIIDENMQPKIPLIFTGPKVWCKKIKKENIPVYSTGRKSILWDNWMASDTSKPTRLSLSPPQRRGKAMYESLEGYLLNPCFPVERIIPVISAVGEIHQMQGANVCKSNLKEYKLYLNKIAHDWSKFLGVDYFPLKDLIYCKNGVSTQKPKNYRHIVSKWPSLEGLFNLVR